MTVTKPFAVRMGLIAIGGTKIGSTDSSLVAMLDSLVVSGR